MRWRTLPVPENHISGCRFLEWQDDEGNWEGFSSDERTSLAPDPRGRGTIIQGGKWDGLLIPKDLPIVPADA